jgi:hypothetical protein
MSVLHVDRFVAYRRSLRCVKPFSAGLTKLPRLICDGDCASHDQHEPRLASALILYLLAGTGGGIPVTADDGPVLWRRSRQEGNSPTRSRQSSRSAAPGGNLRLPQVLLAVISTLLSAAKSEANRQAETPKDSGFQVGTHLEKGATCDEARCDPGQQVSRGNLGGGLEISESGELGTTIRQRTILSGDAVREMVHKKTQSLNLKALSVVEREAVGALCTVACLVIRGIPDYADSHNNENWHG